MAQADVVVVGGGIAGMALAFKAQQAGKRVLVLERERHLGGCLRSERAGDFWYELGGHTVYNSYGAFLDVLVGAGLGNTLVERGPARARFGMLKDGKYRWLTPPKVLMLLNPFEAALHAPLGLLRKKAGRTVGEYYAGVVGRGNFARVLSPFLAAVPSQSADGFPMEGDGSLFKKRPRREEFPRSFGIPGGLQTVCDAVGRLPQVQVETGVEVAGLVRRDGAFEVTARDGRTFRAPLAALAVPPDAAARLLEAELPGVATTLRRIKTLTVDSMGVVLPRAKAWMPECAFLVPVGDTVRSVVTRDPFPDPERRAFAFHFQGGLPRAQRLQRMADILRLPVEELGEVAENRVVLPSPERDHAAVVAELDRGLAGAGLALTGNYFGGLAIEDCVLRSFAEWARVTA